MKESKFEYRKRQKDYSPKKRLEAFLEKNKESIKEKQVEQARNILGSIGGALSELELFNSDGSLADLSPEANSYTGIKNDGMGDTASDTGEMKARWDLLPFECIEKIVEIYTYGAQKYEANSWQKVDSERYFSALHRHLTAWRKGEKYDEESKKTHLAHAAWNILALMWSEMEKEQEFTDFL